MEQIIASGRHCLILLARFAASAGVAALVAAAATGIIRKIFRKKYSSKNAIVFRYTENILKALVIVIAVFWVILTSDVTASFGKVLFQGTAIIGAVAGFAAQPVISDLFCGLMISSMKPFGLGDRIELEDGTSGIVTDITIRHVVLRGLDTEDIIIPNSRMNAMRISNMSHGRSNRSYILSVGVSYDSDIRTAMKAIGEAVKESPYTVPGKPDGDGAIYGPVYFMAYEPSSLMLRTTVYYESKNSTESVKSDINLRVKEKLEAYGIEIPYGYLNVIMKNSGIPVEEEENLPQDVSEYSL